MLTVSPKCLQASAIFSPVTMNEQRNNGPALLQCCTASNGNREYAESCFATIAHILFIDPPASRGEQGWYHVVDRAEL